MIDVVLVSLLLTLNTFISFSSVSVVKLEQVNVCLAILLLQFQKRILDFAKHLSNYQNLSN